MTYLFAYGTLQTERMQTMLLGRTLEGVPARLPGFEHCGGDWTKGQIPMICASKKGDVHIKGTLYKVREDEFKRLDAYEGSGYKRIQAMAQEDKDFWTQSTYVYVKRN